MTREKINSTSLENYVINDIQNVEFEEDYSEILANFWENIIKEINLNDILININESLDFHLLNNLNEFQMVQILRFKGLVLSHISKKELIYQSLDKAFNLCHPEYKQSKINANVQPSTPSIEIRIGVAELFGLSSKANFDLVLETIDSIFKAEIIYKRPTGITALFSKTIIPELSHQIISTLILTIGFVAKYSDINTSSKVLNELLPKINLYFINEKNSVKLSCLIAFQYIFSSLQKVSNAYRVKGETFLFPHREHYLLSMMLIFTKEKVLSEIKVQALSNISLLISLEPSITLDQLKKFVSLALSIYDESCTHKDKLFLKALNNASSVLESVLKHDVHLKINNILSDENNFIYVDFYETILNYETDYFNSWCTFCYILEKFYHRFVMSRDVLKPIILERIFLFFQLKKFLEYKNDEINYWTTCFLCLFMMMFTEELEIENVNFEEIEKYNKNIHSCFVLLCKAEFSFNKNEKIKFIVLLADYISIFLDKTQFLIFFNQSIFLLKSISLNVNRYSSVFLLKLVDLRKDDFLITNEIDNNNKLRDFFEKIFNIINNMLKLSGNQITEQIKNTIAVLIDVSIINSHFFINCLLDEKYGIPLPITVVSILHRVALEKTLLNLIISHLIDLINSNDSLVEKKPNKMTEVSIAILGTIMEVRDESLSIYLKKRFLQLLTTFLQRVKYYLFR